MGRAERRRSERRSRIEERKNKILMGRDELRKMKEEISYEASEYNTENLLTCFALTLVRKGFDEDDIADSMRYLDGLMDDILSGKSTMEDYVKELEEKTGIIIRCKES